MAVVEYVVALQGSVDRLAGAAARVSSVRLRPAERWDLEDLLAVDAACFDGFWRYGEPELVELLATERAVIAQTDSGELIGYTLATVSRGAATLGRLAVSPQARATGAPAAWAGRWSPMWRVGRHRRAR